MVRWLLWLLFPLRVRITLCLSRRTNPQGYREMRFLLAKRTVMLRRLRAADPELYRQLPRLVAERMRQKAQSDKQRQAQDHPPNRGSRDNG